jgi:flagellar motor switch protein FliG
MSKKPEDNIKIDGKKEAATLLAGLDRSTRDRILGDIAKKDPALAAQLKKGLLTFDRVIALDSLSLQKVIRSFTQDLVGLAFRGLTDPEKINVFSKMPERQAHAILDAMDSMGPRKMSDIKAAQDKLCEKAQALIDSGEMNLA